LNQRERKYRNVKKRLDRKAKHNDRANAEEQALRNSFNQKVKVFGFGNDADKMDRLIIEVVFTKSPKSVNEFKKELMERISDII